MEKVKVFLDTNVVVDYFTGRMGDGIAEKIIQVGQDPHFELCISFLTAVNVMYLIGKRCNFLKADVLKKLFTILPQDAIQWDDACDMEVNDFEDAVQAACALRSGSLFAVTRDHHFSQAPIVSFTPEEFLNAVLEG